MIYWNPNLGICQLRCNSDRTSKPKASRTWWTAFVVQNGKRQIACRWHSGFHASWNLLSRKVAIKPACLEKSACGQSSVTSMNALVWQTRTILMRTRWRQSTIWSVDPVRTLVFDSVGGGGDYFCRGCQQLSLTKGWSLFEKWVPLLPYSEYSSQQGGKGSSATTSRSTQVARGRVQHRAAEIAEVAPRIPTSCFPMPRGFAQSFVCVCWEPSHAPEVGGLHLHWGWPSFESFGTTPKQTFFWGVWCLRRYCLPLRCSSFRGTLVVNWNPEKEEAAMKAFFQK